MISKTQVRLNSFEQMLFYIGYCNNLNRFDPKRKKQTNINKRKPVILSLSAHMVIYVVVSHPKSSSMKGILRNSMKFAGYSLTNQKWKSNNRF